MIPIVQKMKSNSVRYLLFLFPLFLLAQDTESAAAQVPSVAEITGQVNRYNQANGTFQPIEKEYRFSSTSLIVTGEGGELFISFPGRISARVGENSRVVIGPAVDDLYEADLRLGTVTARLDPDRDRLHQPGFAIRTKDGVSRATRLRPLFEETSSEARKKK